jgi:Cu+-exporting ATPase
MIMGPRDIIAAIDALGFTAILAPEQDRNKLIRETEERQKRYYAKRAFYAFLFAVPTFLLSMIFPMILPHHSPFSEWLNQTLVPGLQLRNLLLFLLATPVQFWLGWGFYKGAYKAICHSRSANVNIS